MSETTIFRVHIWVRGRVQGVGFRAFVQQTAMIMGLKGWVRNVGWDQVEAVAEGDKAALEKFIEAVRTGPRASHVEDSRFDWEAVSGDCASFDVRSSR